MLRSIPYATRPLTTVTIDNRVVRRAAVTTLSATSSQKLGGSFLPARSQVQYLITHPIRMQNTFEFSFTAEGGTVTNRSPYMLKRLIVRDANGNYWQTENPVGGEPTPLKLCKSRL